MGKTLNTRPTRARREVYVEYHDHTDGVCNLPTLEEFLKDYSRRFTHWKKRECSWVPDWHKMYDTRCSCDCCSDPYSPARKRRELQQSHPTSVDAW